MPVKLEALRQSHAGACNEDCHRTATWGGRSRPESCLIAAEQVLRNTRRVEDEVARSLKLTAQRMHIDVE
jgi:hypothetical protein